MGILGNALSRLIDNGERQALSLMSEAQRVFDNFDFDATVNSINEGMKSAYADFNDFMKTVKDSVSDFKVIVPFNEKKENFKYNVENGVLKVSVCSKNVVKNFSQRETTATIPSNCILERISHTIDKKHGNLIVTIPKNVAEDENLKKAKEAVTTKVNGTVDWIKNALKEKAEAVAASSAAPTSKPGQHKRPSKPKIVRGKDGKFVSTKVASKKA